MEKYSKKYQHKVIDRLNKSWKISDSQKVLWDFWVTLWSITKYFWLRIDFIIDNQSWVVNIANKTWEQNSNFSIINIANQVKSQVQKIWVQIANHSDKQELKAWIQVSYENYDSQKNWYWIQSTKKWKKQTIDYWIQLWQDLNWSDQTATWFALQIVKIITWSQIWNKWAQIADTVTWNQLLKRWYQFWKYIHSIQKVSKWISVK